eukprot:184184-Prymnesium_polylepis.1
MVDGAPTVVRFAQTHVCRIWGTRGGCTWARNRPSRAEHRSVQGVQGGGETRVSGRGPWCVDAVERPGKTISVLACGGTTVADKMRVHQGPLAALWPRGCVVPPFRVRGWACCGCASQKAPPRLRRGAPPHQRPHRHARSEDCCEYR